MNNVVFIDIDGVLINKQTQELFLIFLFKRRKILPWKALVIYLWFILYKLGLCKDIIKIREFAFKQFYNWDQNEMSVLIDEFYHSYLSANLNQEILNRLKGHQSKNDVIVFLSATLEEITKYLAGKLNVKHVIATQLELKEGKYTGNMVGIIPYGTNKTKFAQDFINKNGLNFKRIVAYCDHYSDLSLLSYVNQPVVVNPDNKLKKLALLNKWEILVN
jgi:HAD superfamily hydrolase (TIGR01490 family)